MQAGLSRSEGLFFTLEAARLSEAVLQQLNLAMPSPAEKVRPPSADDSPQGVVIARDQNNSTFRAQGRLDALDQPLPHVRHGPAEQEEDADDR